MPDSGDRGGFQGSGRGGNPGNSGAGYGSNNRGTAYSKQLGEAIARANMRNAPAEVDPLTQSIVQERGGLTFRSVSPNDLAAAAGLMAQANRFGPDNNDVQRALGNAYSRVDPGAATRGVLGSYNLGMGVNPTTNMGLIDSLAYNTIDQPEFRDLFSPMNIFGGLLGAATGLPFAGMALKGLLDRKDKQEKNVKMAKLEGKEIGS